jgi:Flp pilus assembly protein TadB
MAQTKRKRRRKHRGTQAGTIDARGRTSKPPASGRSRGASSSGSSRGSSRSAGSQSAAEKRQQRLDTPPTWRSAVNRAAFAAAILVIFIAVVQKSIAQGVVMGVFALAIYVPMSYYTDLWLYRRRQRKKTGAAR